MLDKQDEMILFRVFNTILNFQNCETFNEYEETKRLTKEEPAYKMIDSKELRDYFIKKYNIDIE